MEKRIVLKGTDFASPEDFQRHSRVVDASQEKLSYSGLPVDWIGDNSYATTVPEQHALIIGDTGCGKTRRLIIPSVRLISKTGESMVLSDPKGELYRKTASSLRKKGYDIRVLNLREPRNGDRWNPLEIIEKMYRSDDPDVRDKALIMLEEIIDMAGTDVESDGDRYWASVAKQFLKAVCLTILEFGDPGDLNFTNIAVLESQISSVILRRIENGGKEKDDEVVSFMRFFRSLDPDSAIRQNFQGAVNVSAEKTFTCISSVAHTMANAFVRQKAVQFLLSSTDFDISGLGEKSTALFIILPDEIGTLYPLATMFVNQIYSILCDEAYTNGGMLNVKVNFILDEFANFARLDNISQMLTASRSRGMRFFLVCQDVDQLESVYGRNGSAILRSNCQSWIYMGCRNTEFLRMLVELSGTYTETYTGRSMPLLSMTDLQLLETGEAFVFIKGCSVKHCYLPDYEDIDFGEGKETDEKLPPRNGEEERKPIELLNIMMNAFLKVRVNGKKRTRFERIRDRLLRAAWNNISEFDDDTLDIIRETVGDRINSSILSFEEAEAGTDLLFSILESVFTYPPDMAAVMRMRSSYKANQNAREKVEAEFRSGEIEKDISSLMQDFIAHREEFESFFTEENFGSFSSFYRADVVRIKLILLGIMEQYRKLFQPELDLGFSSEETIPPGDDDDDDDNDESDDDEDDELFGDEYLYAPPEDEKKNSRDPAETVKDFFVRYGRKSSPDDTLDSGKPHEGEGGDE